MKGAKGKKPVKELYFKDVLADIQLQSCRASTRGIWFNVLCFFWQEGGSGELFGYDLDELARLGGATHTEAALFIKDAQKHKFCDIEIGGADECPEIVRLANRRLVNEARQREQWAKEKREQRGRGDVQGESGEVPPDVQPSRARPTPTPSPSPLKETTKKATASKPAGPPQKTNYAEQAGTYFKQIENLTPKIDVLVKDAGLSFNVHQLIKKSLNGKIHPGCVHEMCEALVVYWEKAVEVGPYRYAMGVIKRANGNHWEKVAVEDHQEAQSVFHQLLKDLKTLRVEANA